MNFADFWSDYGHLAEHHLNDFFSDENRLNDPLLENPFGDDDDKLISFAAGELLLPSGTPLGLLQRRVIQLTGNAQPTGHEFDTSIGKKNYEISLMAEYLQNLTEQRNNWCLVDCGAGKGLLAQEMNERGFEVWAIEGNPKLAQQSTVRLHWHNWQIPKHVSSEEFYEKLKLPLDRPVLLYSLHGCGDLSETMIELYRKGKFHGLVNVGCCYNLLTQSPFSREALMAACQAPRRWPHCRAESKLALERCFWRASLYGLVPKDCSLARIKASCWADYVKLVSKRLSLDLTSAEYDLSLRPRFAMAWALRAMVGQVIEAKILADRMHSIPESQLVPLFELARSPRNLALVALK